MKQNRWAIVTGASSGIGQATALRLSEQGYHLVLLARREERLTQLKAKILEKKPDLQIQLAPIDLQDRQKLTQFVENLQKQQLEIHVLINSAGLALGTDKAQEGKIEDWDVMIDVNVKAVLALTRLVLPIMIKNKSGSIVNIGSVAGRWVYPGGAVYCATKHAIRAISEGLRMDLLGSGIRVTNIEPGMVETEFSEVRLKDPEKAKAVYYRMKPLVAEDVADSIMWCLNQPQHINIQELVIFPTDQASVRDVARNG